MGATMVGLDSSIRSLNNKVRRVIQIKEGKEHEIWSVKSNFSRIWMIARELLAVIKRGSFVLYFDF